MTIRESIIHYQDKQGITSLTLCKECGVNKTVYSDFRNGNRNHGRSFFMVAANN